MTRQDAIEDAYLLVENKAVDIGSIPTAKRDILTRLAIKFNREWQTEPNMEWDSLYDVVSAGTVTATDTFALATTINFIATQEQHILNRVRILHTDGTNYTEYDLVKPGELYQAGKAGRQAVAYIRSTNSVQFAKAFTSDDSEFGGTIQVPAITKLADLTDDTSVVQIDDEEWLPWRMAAQYAYGTTSKRSMYDDLLAAANDRMTGMQGRNSTGNETTSTGIDYFASMGNVGIEC